MFGINEMAFYSLSLIFLLFVYVSHLQARLLETIRFLRVSYITRSYML